MVISTIRKSWYNNYMSVLETLAECILEVEKRMLRRSGSGSIRRQSSRMEEEEVNPMASVANLVDAMLVLAVGIMLALINSWNLNISQNGQVTEKVDKKDAVSSFSDKDLDKTKESDSSSLEKQGTVYYDKATDRYYIIASDGSKVDIDK